jgi:importin subunit alpha-1
MPKSLSWTNIKRNLDDEPSKEFQNQKLPVSSPLLVIEPIGMKFTRTTSMVHAFSELLITPEIVLSPQYQRMFIALVELRKFLSVENPPVEHAMDIIPALVTILNQANGVIPTLFIHQAAWVITNVAGGSATQTTHVVQAGAIPLMVRLLTHANVQIREQAVWCLANIAVDVPKQVFCFPGVVTRLVHMLTNEHRLSLKQHLTWLATTLVRGASIPDMLLLLPLFVPMRTVLGEMEDVDCLMNALMFFVCICNGTRATPL